MTENNSFITLDISDNTKMKAYISTPQDKNTTYPGLILFQEAGGVNQQIKRVAERFSKEGYIVITPELFHRSSDSEYAFSIDHVDMNLIMPHLKALTIEGLSADIQASWDWLQNTSQVQTENIACLGFCMGGRTAFLANTLLPFKAAVSYYGGGIVPDLINSADKLHSDMLFFWGGQDDHIPHEHVEQITSKLREVGKNYTNIEFSYTGHAFFRDGSEVYNEKAANESWAIALQYLKDRLTTTG